MAYVPKFDNTPEGRRLQKKYELLKKEQGTGAAENLLFFGRAGFKAKKKTKKSKSRNIG